MTASPLSTPGRILSLLQKFSSERAVDAFSMIEDEDFTPSAKHNPFKSPHELPSIPPARAIKLCDY